MYCSATCREAGRHAALRALGVRRIAERAERRAERATRREVELLRDPRLPVPEGVLLLTHAVYDQAIRDQDKDWLTNLDAQGFWWTVLREVTE